MTDFLPFSVPAAHLPIRSPALKLSVAMVRSTVSAGSGGVSRAMIKAVRVDVSGGGEDASGAAPDRVLFGSDWLGGPLAPGYAYVASVAR